MHSILKTKFVVEMEFEKLERRKKVKKNTYLSYRKKKFKISATILMF